MFFGLKACGILAPWPGIEPAPPELEGEVFNHWTAREVPLFSQFFKRYFSWFYSTSGTIEIFLKFFKILQV